MIPLLSQLIYDPTLSQLIYDPTNYRGLARMEEAHDAPPPEMKAHPVFESHPGNFEVRIKRFEERELETAKALEAAMKATQAFESHRGNFEELAAFAGALAKQRAVNKALIKLVDAEFGVGLKLDALHELQAAIRETLK
jgi:hypothetical protein